MLVKLTHLADEIDSMTLTLMAFGRSCRRRPALSHARLNAVVQNALCYIIYHIAPLLSVRPVLVVGGHVLHFHLPRRSTSVMRTLCLIRDT